MDWRRATIAWNEETFPGAAAIEGDSVLEDVDVVLDGAWVHIRTEGSIRSYPSHVVFRVIWLDDKAKPWVAFD